MLEGETRMVLGLRGGDGMEQCGEGGAQAAVGEGPHGAWRLGLDGILELGRSAHDLPPNLFRPSYTYLNSAVTPHGILKREFPQETCLHRCGGLHLLSPRGH